MLSLLRYASRMGHLKEFWRGSRRCIAAMSTAAAFALFADLHAQDAAPSSMDLQSRDTEKGAVTPPPLPSPAGSPTPIDLPPREAEPPSPTPMPPEVPELSALDEAFKKT